MDKEIVIKLKIPEELGISELWLISQLKTLILKRSLERNLLKALIADSKLTEENVVEIGEKIKESAWKKLKEAVRIHD
ncbi:MAG: hypothetical protein ACP6IQ_10965 [Candidatus Njordarchaeia archaeon]